MINTSLPTYYDILEIATTASQDDIRVAYRKQALKRHPDKAGLNNLTIEVATELFKKLQKANEVLSNPDKRNLYDYTIRLEKTFKAEKKKATDWPVPLHPANIHELHYPAIRSFKETAPGTIREIFDKDDDVALAQFVEDTNCANQILKCMLYEACFRGKLNLVKYLIEMRKLDPRMEVNSSDLQDPIFKAAVESGNLELVKYLFEEKRADIESKRLVKPEWSDTAFIRAVKRGHEDVVRYLILNKADVNPCYEGRYNMLSFVIDSGKLAIVKLVIEAGLCKDHMCVDKALRQGSEDIVKYLLGKQPLADYTYDEPPVFLAISSGNVALVKYLEDNHGVEIPKKMDNQKILQVGKSNSIEMMNFLIEERGICIEPDQFELLIKTVIQNLSPVMQQAIDAMPIVTLEKPKMSPLKEADLKAFKLIQFLIEKTGFSLSKTYLNDFCENERWCGIRTYSYLRSFLLKGLNEENKRKLLVIANKCLKPLNISSLFKIHNSKLLNQYMNVQVHHSIEELNISIEDLKRLCSEEIEVMTEALFYYSHNHFRNNLSKLEGLLKLGVDLNAENSEGLAAIHIALESDGPYSPIVKFYVDNGADLLKINKEGKTAAQILQENVYKKTEEENVFQQTENEDTFQQTETEDTFLYIECGIL